MRYISLDDVKTHIGVTGSSNDAFLTREIRHAEDRLDSILSVRRLDIHKVADERHDATGVTCLFLKDIQVVEIGEILDDETVYSQDDPYDIKNYLLYLEEALTGGIRNAHIDYAAGWNASGIAKLTVSDYDAITAAMTLAIEPGGTGGATTLTEGVEWNAATDNNATATSIADAINLKLKVSEDAATGIRAFALESVVYIVDQFPNRETSTITANDLTGLTLVSGTGTVGVATTALIMDGRDFPYDLEDALVLMIGQSFTTRSSQGIKSYKIGSKSVTFSNGELMKEIKSMTKPYSRVTVNAI